MMTTLFKALAASLCLSDPLPGASGGCLDRNAEQLALAASIARWAEDHGDADAMAVAADLLRSHELGSPVAAEGGVEINASALFGGAAGLATEAEAAARVERRRSLDPRGVVRALGEAGPIGRLMLVGPDRPLTFTIVARGSEQTLLHVGPTGGGHLDVLVVDERGQAVCMARALAAPLLCSWRPTFSSRYVVRIRALSAAPVTTVVTSN